MTLVIDASALAGWLMPDETGSDLVALAGRHDVFAAPALLWAEIRNILIVAERRGRMSREKVDQAIETIAELGIVLDTAPSSAAVVGLCRRHRLTAYDAPYLDLTLRENAELATLDAALAQAARAEGASVV
ncbi:MULTISPECIES: type II toxin-antitoxin system VapC family toxin [unclassified Roseitalea]|uniref:type II toxin-antitoxin system VapC family toxin n=1 Tax=unclassified Roseitalea TaxID=2639107 RepID=UPI00273E4ABB|nr:MULTISPECIES: type II toxin-antitoxin system VapC family toxin [unclassified Roseitalea]